MIARRLVTAAVVGLVAALCCMPEARGESTLAFRAVAVEVPEKGPYGRVYAGSEPVLTIGGYGWKSVAVAQEVARRLNEFAEEGLGGEELTLGREGKAWVVLARGRMLVHIDSTVAAVHGSQADELGRVWVENLQTVFSRPYLAMKPMVVPVGEMRVATVAGNWKGALSVGLDSPVASAVWDDQERVVRVAGFRVGEGELLVSDGANLLSVSLSVMKYAGQWDKALPARVTGRPASADVVARAVKAAASAGVVLEPGAWGSVTPRFGEPAALGEGKSTQVQVRVSAAGEGYLPRREQQKVSVRNERMELAPPAALMVSNNPERLRSQGLWFEGKLGELKSARLLYHHVNGTGSTGDFVTELWNLGDRMAWVHVTAGVGGPSRDEAWVGHRAAVSFLSNRKAGAGWMVPVPAGTMVSVLTQRAAAGTTVSAVLELRMLEEAPLRVRVYLARPVSERLPRRIEGYQVSPLLGQWHYHEARQERREEYTVGQRWAFVSIGDVPATGVAEGDLLAGSYGVMYDVYLELRNPTAEAAAVAVMMEPGGGTARAALLVDGRLVEAAMIGSDEEVPLSKYLLAPGEVRRVHLELMPQAGSNYPVRIVAKPG